MLARGVTSGNLPPILAQSVHLVDVAERPIEQAGTSEKEVMVAAEAAGVGRLEEVVVRRWPILHQEPVLLADLVCGIPKEVLNLTFKLRASNDMSIPGQAAVLRPSIGLAGECGRPENDSLMTEGHSTDRKARLPCLRNAEDTDVVIAHWTQEYGQAIVKGCR